MFYAVMNEAKQYLNDKGEFGPYVEATQFSSTYDAGFATFENDQAGVKIVGPCNEGEEP